MLPYNSFKPINIVQQMSLYDFWLGKCQPMLPILADEAQLAIGQLEQVLPNFVKVILLKLSTKITPYTAYNQQGLSDLAENPLVSNLRLLLPVANTLKAQGLNFLTVSRLSQQSQSIFEQFFEDDTQTLILAGVLLEKTQLPLHKLLTIWQLLTTLTLASLADIIDSLHHKMTTPQMNAWIAMQPIFFVTPNDVGLMQALNYRAPSSIREMQKQRQTWRKISTLADLLPYQQLIVQQMQRVQTANFFRIAPIARLNEDTQDNSMAKQDNSYGKLTPNNGVLNDNIFAKPHPTKTPRWLDILQKNWIATATALSVAVFGSVGALVHVKDKASIQPSTKLSPQKSFYQDVAIVKVASVPSADDPLTTVTDTKKTNKFGQTEKITSAHSKPAKVIKKPNKQQAQKNDNLTVSSASPHKKIASKSHGHKALSPDEKKLDSHNANKASVSDKKTTNKYDQANDKAVKPKNKVTSSKTAKHKKTDKSSTQQSTDN